MPSTHTSSTSSRMRRRTGTRLAVVGTLALLVAGCADLYGQATDDARHAMGRLHAEAVGCLGRVVAAQPDVARAREVIARCVDTRREGTNPTYLSPGSFQEGSWLLSIDYADTAWTLEVVDVGYGIRYQGEIESHRAVIQCWTTTLDFESSTMTEPTRVACPSDIENAVVGKDALEESHLVTSAPSK